MSEVATTFSPPGFSRTVRKPARRDQRTLRSVHPDPAVQAALEPSAYSELLRLAQAGDNSAFEKLLGQHQTQVRSLCRSLTRNQADLEDAYQESVQAIWAGLPRFRGDENAQLSTWIYRVTTNSVARLYRKRVPEPVEAAPETVSHPSAGPEDLVVNRELTRWALNQLPDEFREALVLADQLGLRYREIADIQIVSESTVKTRVFRARQALRHLLELTSE